MKAVQKSVWVVGLRSVKPPPSPFTFPHGAEHPQNPCSPASTEFIFAKSLLSTPPVPREGNRSAFTPSDTSPGANRVLSEANGIFRSKINCS